MSQCSGSGIALQKEVLLHVTSSDLVASLVASEEAPFDVVPISGRRLITCPSSPSTPQYDKNLADTLRWKLEWLVQYQGIRDLRYGSEIATEYRARHRPPHIRRQWFAAEERREQELFNRSSSPEVEVESFTGELARLRASKARLKEGLLKPKISTASNDPPHQNRKEGANMEMIGISARARPKRKRTQKEKEVTEEYSRLDRDLRWHKRRKGRTGALHGQPNAKLGFTT